MNIYAWLMPYTHIQEKEEFVLQTGKGKEAMSADRKKHC
jgi:hypothetical protein